MNSIILVVASRWMPSGCATGSTGCVERPADLDLHAAGAHAVASSSDLGRRETEMSSTTTIDGRNVSYRQSGATGSGHTVLMVHGATDHSWIWKNQMEALNPRHRCVAVDLPGRIGTDGPPIDAAAGFRAFIASVADALELEPFVFCGHSMGGSMALDFALHHPARSTAS